MIDRAALAARATWAAYFGFKALPSSLASGFGAAISVIPRKKFKPTTWHLRELFAALRPDWAGDPALLEAAVGRAWANAARVYAEVPGCHRLVERGHVTIANVERLDEAIASWKPIILAFVHTGNWEATGVSLANRYAPARRGLAIYDPPRTAVNAAIVQHEREKMPADLIPLSPMVWRHALARLREPGGTLWIPVDEVAAGRVTAPFFGRPPSLANNLGKIARLAMRTGAIVVPFYGERHPHLRFTTHILPTMTFAGDPGDDAAVLAAVMEIEAVLAPPIVRLIDQWYMALFFHDTATLPKVAVAT